MGLYAVKPWFVARLRRFEDRAVAAGIHANALSVGAIVASVGAGVALACGGIFGMPLLWLAVPVLVLVRLAFNALDGSIARRTHSAGPSGAILNEVGDRVSDAAMLGGAAFTVEPAVAAGAVAASFAASLTGVLALGLTGRRDHAGPMGKADRAAALSIGAVAAALLTSTTPIVLALAIITVGALLTAGVRVARLHRAVTTPARAPEARLIEFPLDVVPEEVLDGIAG